MLTKDEAVRLLHCPKMQLVEIALNMVNLTHLERQVITLHICQERTLEQTAEALSRSRNNIQTLTNAAIAKIQLALSGEDLLIKAILTQGEK